MKKDLEHFLQNMEIPEPGKEAMENAVKAAMHEFNNQQNFSQKKVKGIKDERRLKGVLNIFSSLFGGRNMRRSFAFTSSLVGILLILGFCITYFVTYNQKPSDDSDVFDVAVLQDESKQSKIIVAQNDFEDKSVTDGKLMEKDILQPALRSSEVETLNKKHEEGLHSLHNRKPVGKTNKTGIDDFLLLEEHTVSIASKPSHGIAGEQRMSFSETASPINQSSANDYRTYEYKETGRDQFDKFTPNPIKKVSEEPVSTFSIDVDTSSYTFIRRQLNNGQLPQKNAVRIEEMINYFDYDYIVPSEKTKPFQPTVAVFPSPWNENTKLLHIGIKGYDIVPEKKPKANLVFLIDVSGSMDSHDKLPLLKNSFRMIVNTLDEEDTVAIVVYAGSAGTVLEPTKIKDKDKILASLENLKAGGSTAGGEGIMKAYALAEANFNKEGVNRIILATDGDFNVGIRDHEELKSYIERKRESGIFLSVLGFGQGNYNDALMQKLAQNGNGNASYIDTLNEARKVLVDEVSSTLFTIAKDVKIQLEFNPKLISEYRLIGYESRILRREDFNNDKIDAGDIGSGHAVTAIYEITPVESRGKLIDDLRYSDKESAETTKNSFEKEYAFLKIRYKLPDSDQSELMNTPITVNNEYDQISKVPDDIKFAASVAAFGQILRGGAYTEDFGYNDVIKLAETAIIKDSFGYRHEFINLVRFADSIK